MSIVYWSMYAGVYTVSMDYTEVVRPSRVVVCAPYQVPPPHTLQPKHAEHAMVCSPL